MLNWWSSSARATDCRDRHDLVAGEHELADHAHELVEQADVHADAGGGDAAAVVVLGGGGWRRGLDDGCGDDGCGDDGCGCRHGHGGDRGLGHRDLGGLGLDRRCCRSGRGLEAARERGLDVGGVQVALDAGLLDLAEEGADDVDHLQQDGRDLGREVELSVAQLRQDVLADVRDSLEPVEGEEAAGALDGVDRAEDRGEEGARARVLLELDQCAVELVEVLVALDQELLGDLVEPVGEDRGVRHCGWTSLPSMPPAPSCRGSAPVPSAVRVGC